MYIKFFKDISKHDVKEVGGKGASLGEMINADFPIPLGFVITTEAKGEINEQEIFKAFDKLNAERVSVRSSAVAEDSSSASWAGQLETFLNVSKEDLIEKIKECWGSIKSDRAVSYASDQNLSEDQLEVGVVVQKMVDAKSAGVMFTANPVNNDIEEVMIESVLGLGESLVSGSVTPDNFILDKETGEIISKDIAQVDESISEEELRELVEYGKKIEAHYGRPQDIEWAIDENGKIWILQSRPITTL